MDKTNEKRGKAILRSAAKPSQEIQGRLLHFLMRRYKKDFTLQWEQDIDMTDGFVLQAGSDVYDWSIEGRLRQFKDRLEQLHPANREIIPLIKETVNNWIPEVMPEEMGEVISVGDEIATVSGLEHAAYGEILLFSSGVKGMVQDLKEGEIGCILFGDEEEIVEGSIVRRTGKTAGIPVGEEFLGRVINALGEPIDGKGEIQASEYRPIEAPAPSIIERQRLR